MELREGFLFGSKERYLLKKLLGRGGFAEVWLADDTWIENESVALKIYVPGIGLDEDGVELFSREYGLVSRLSSHGHLLKPQHFDVFDRSPFLVLPYCEQGTTVKLVGKITEEEAWRFLHDVASGLAYLHKQKPPIIHQDIKPDNVLIDQGNYLISDFGISSKARSTLRKSIESVVEKKAGAIAYMSPERFGKDNKPIMASDIWAFGATLFELMTGDVPFGEYGGSIQKGGADIPHINGNYSENLKTIVYKMLALQPWDRPLAEKLVEWAEKRKGEDEDTMLKMEITPKTLIFKADGGTKTVNVSTDSSSYEVTNLPAWCSISNKSKTSFVIKCQPNAGMKRNERIIVKSGNMEDHAVVKQAAAKSVNPWGWVAGGIAAIIVVLLVVFGIQMINENNEQTRKQKEREEIARIEEEKRQQVKRDSIARIEEERRNQAKLDSIARMDEAKRQQTERDRIAHEEQARREQDCEKRLSNYTQFNKNLGTNYMVVQRKSDRMFGIIDKCGYEKVDFIYAEASRSLKNGCFGLLNKQNKWDVFNASLTKIATSIDNLDNYRIEN